MKYLSLMLLTFALVACKNDKFMQEYDPAEEGRFRKSYKMDTTSSESYAVDVDILWVIDNSGSMGQYQQKVIDNSAAFIAQFTASSRLHWKMGLISTSYYEAPYMGFANTVDWQTPNAIQQFNDAVARLGTGGDGTAERTFEPTVKALNNHPGWLRPNAYLIVIAVSDELEQSTMTVNQFIQYMTQKLGNIARLLTYGVYGPNSNDSRNQKYNEIVQRSNGKIYQLNAPDYGKVLSELGKDLVTKTTAVFPVVLLDQKPKAGTIRVIYKGRVLQPGVEWIYNAQFNYIEIRDTKILDNKYLDVDVSFEIDRS